MHPVVHQIQDQLVLEDELDDPAAALLCKFDASEKLEKAPMEATDSME